MTMKRCTAAILLMLSLEALVAGRLSVAVGDDTIRLPSQGLPNEMVMTAREKGDEKKMPWKCCDVTECTRSLPPACRCMDKVERCDDACTRCEVSKTDPSKHVCADRYRGFPPARCTKPVNGDGIVEAAARPWTCCDDTLCTMSFPPTCYCQDKVKKCAKTCNVCEKADGASSRYVCRDSYFGWPGPTCTKPNSDDVPNGSGVATRERATAAVAVAAIEGQRLLNDTMLLNETRLLNDTMLLNSTEKSVATGGEEQARPWKCCDDSLCTRSSPPTCVCHDKVKKCAKTCKVCEKADGDSSRYVCRDIYFGWSPRCTKPVTADVRLGN